MNIEATVAAIAADIRHMRDDIAEIKADGVRTEMQANSSRARVHERLDTVVAQVHALEKGQQSLDASHKSLSSDVADMKQVTDEVKRWKLMGMTSLSIVGIGAAGLGITFADSFKRVLYLIGIRY